MATMNSNSISGITTTVFEKSDVVNKQYTDDNIPAIESVSGNADKFLITTDGVSLTWEYLSGTEEYTTAGIHTFYVPSQANLLYIEATGAGGGGSAGFDDSREPIEWSSRTTGSFGDHLAAAYGNGFYILAKTTTAEIVVSTNTIVWVSRTNAITDYGTALAYGGGFYVFGSYNGKITASTDTIHWVLRTSSTTVALRDIKYLNSEFHAVGSSSRYYSVSTDTIHWILRTSGLGDTEGYRILYGNSLYLMSGASSYAVSSSTDAIHWTQRTAPGSHPYRKAIGVGGGIFLNAGYGISLTASTDAIHWSFRTAPIGNIGSTEAYDIGYESGNWVMVGQFGMRQTSTDSIHWTQRTAGGANYRAFYVDGNWIVAGESNAFFVSEIQKGGNGGAGGSYASWYVPKTIMSSDITVNIGVGGVGASSVNSVGSPGAGTTVSWTGPAGSYSLTASGAGQDGAAGQNILSKIYYSTSGGPGGSKSQPNAGIQSASYQSTGGGAGAGSTSTAGGDGGQINVYGISTSASGGTSSGTNGLTGTAYTAIAFGSGGGGGGASVSIAATGGNGARGGGGGGGASIGSAFGNGGNGGDGYVKITWW